MANDRYDIRIQEILHKTSDQIVEAEYIYNEVRDNDDARAYRVFIQTIRI